MYEAKTAIPVIGDLTGEKAKDERINCYSIRLANYGGACAITPPYQLR
jgi:hypothetical protein